MKPYQQVPIYECHELLVEIPTAHFAVETPHPYAKLLAPYGDKSPYFLRQGVLERLLTAQSILQEQQGWRIQIFDAYRPILVQQFMVEHTFNQTVKELMQAEKLTDATLTGAQRQAILEQVYQFWALPSLDPAMPPPHSTGAAVDVTLVDAAGQVIDMGSPIDEMSPRSYPDYYANQDSADQVAAEPGVFDFSTVGSGDSDEKGNQAQFHRHRQILKFAMTTAGFKQHPREWWHFSYGDQLWAWLTGQSPPYQQPSAWYGAI